MKPFMKIISIFSISLCFFAYKTGLVEDTQHMNQSGVQFIVNERNLETEI